MSFTIPGVGGRVPTWLRQRTQQHPPGAGPPGSSAAEAVQADEVATSATAGEQARTGIAAIHQAIQVTEQGLALVATARHGLEAVQQRLTRMAAAIRRTLTERPSGSGPPPPEIWRGALRALEDDARAIDSLARDTRFGGIRLLDGSCGCRGAAFGPWLEFVAADSSVRSSPPEGFAVVLRQEPTRAAVLGELPLTEELIAAGETLALETEARRVEVRTRAGQSLADVVRELNDAAEHAGLPLAALIASGERLLVHHRRYGKGRAFRVRSSTPGILSARDGSDQVADNGRDVIGTINGEPAMGEGQLLAGEPGNRTTAGLVVRYTGTPPPGFEPTAVRGRETAGAAPRDGWKDGQLQAGRVLIVQRSLTLRLDASARAPLLLRIDAATCAELGRSGLTTEGMACVADTLKAAPDQAERALAVIERAREEVALTAAAARRAECETLTGHLVRLRIAAENLLATQGAAGPPADVAAWVAQVGVRLRLEGLGALSAQRYPRPTALLRLLGDGDEVGPG